MEVVSRKKAIEAGLIRYFTGKPCKRGHICDRYVNGRKCVDCTEMFKKANRERTKHTDAYKAAQAKRSKRWRELNPEKSNQNHYNWAKRKPHMPVAAQARYRANKRQQTPAWADHEKINLIYQDCRELTEALGELFHVDHIIPLQGKYVSGLHWEANLQILGAAVNQRKSNKAHL